MAASLSYPCPCLAKLSRSSLHIISPSVLLAKSSLMDLCKKINHMHVNTHTQQTHTQHTHLAVLRALRMIPTIGVNPVEKGDTPVALLIK